MTLKDYLVRVRNEEKLVINTPTQEDFDNLMKELDKTEAKWSSNRLPCEVSFGHVGYGMNSCININEKMIIQYADKEFYLFEGYSIIPFSTLTLDEPTNVDKAIELLNQAIELLKGWK